MEMIWLLWNYQQLETDKWILSQCFTTFLQINPKKF